MENVIVAKNKKFVVVSTKMIHEDHVTYICTWSNRTYLVRTFNTDYEKALADYKVLKRAGINMAKMCFHDDAAKVIVFDYFPEEDCLTTLSKGPLPDIYFDALFALYRFARFSKVSLDWEPQNFMLRGTQMFYLPTKWEPMNEQNGLEKAAKKAVVCSRGKALISQTFQASKKTPSINRSSFIPFNIGDTLSTCRNRSD